MLDTQSNTVTIKIVYFKSSGKFYADHAGDYEVTLFTGCHSPADVGRKLRELRKLPGTANNTWDGIFMVDFADFNTTKHIICGYPELVMPQ